uniref:NADH-ubiquinone oxidoreductase chain 2 n=1 Tax=Ophidiaster granifer TaxID=2696483 RepID=A0A7S8CUI3_9ECHI|nr:NADH dehydrogenase subunit 2 [Ophidiaster granifer]QPC56381.1 NADH dehydrogenase subunit 2 [Ophidiaster granifer]
MHRSTTLILVLNVITSTVIVASSYHWFSVWVGLEMNTLSILPILCYQFSPRNVESTIKYFLVQSFSAAIILNAVLIQAWLYSSWSVIHPLNVFTSAILVLSLSLKLGLFPCHYWFPDVIQGVNFIQGLILSTWQKVAPLIILLSISDHIETKYLIVIGTGSVLIGGWGGLNQTQVRKILAFSSISHMGWICSVIGYSASISIVMVLVYIIINSSIFIISNEFGLYSLSYLNRVVFINSAGGFCLVLAILSLGGLPPLTGFLNKFLGLNCLIENGNFLAGVLLIVGSLLSLFFYLRITFNSSLVLFPEHTLTMFTWRNGYVWGGITFPQGIILGVLVSLSVFGLVSLPFLGSNI